MQQSSTKRSNEASALQMQQNQPLNRLATDESRQKQSGRAANAAKTHEN